MPKKKHWATRLKERNAELENEVQMLREKVGAVPRPNMTADFSELIAAIDKDAKTVDANTVANMLLNDVCIKHNCRENVFIMEKGESIQGQPFRLTDGEYKVVSRGMLERILAETQVDAIQWQSESYDCEDIARKFVTRCADLGVNSVGRVMSWSGKHAFCVAIVQKGDGVEAVFLEPQTDEIVEVLDGNYSLENALIVVS